MTDTRTSKESPEDRALRVLPKELEGAFWDDVRKRLVVEFFKIAIEERLRYRSSSREWCECSHADFEHVDFDGACGLCACRAFVSLSSAPAARGDAAPPVGVREMTTAREVAEKALRALGKEDLLYTHHTDVHARAGAYVRLAEFIEEYAEIRMSELRLGDTDDSAGLTCIHGIFTRAPCVGCGDEEPARSDHGGEEVDEEKSATCEDGVDSNQCWSGDFRRAGRADRGGKAESRSASRELVDGERPVLTRKVAFVSRRGDSPEVEVTDSQCEERVWDNGDMTDCGKRLPCPKHPAKEVVARKAIDEIRRVLDNRYEPGEKYTDRLAAVGKLVFAGVTFVCCCYDADGVGVIPVSNECPVHSDSARARAVKP